METQEIAKDVSQKTRPHMRKSKALGIADCWSEALYLCEGCQGVQDVRQGNSTSISQMIPAQVQSAQRKAKLRHNWQQVRAKAYAADAASAKRQVLERRKKTCVS